MKIKTIPALLAIATVILVAAVSPNHATDPESSQSARLASAAMVDGVAVYVMTEPVDPYTVVDKVSTKTAVVVSCDLSSLVGAAVKKTKRAKDDFDALILDGSGEATLIRFD